ncbi:hypothetical protein D4R52_00120 [bacterium]|nr:MAG: hypothetical protein D4R52_00120 [bacterium]
MRWKKSSPKLIARFEQILPLDTRIDRRKMFGCPCAFLNKQLFIGLHQENLILRLPERTREKFMKKYKAKIFSPMPGRTMKEYVVVPPKLQAKPEFRKWILISMGYVSKIKK